MHERAQDLNALDSRLAQVRPHQCHYLGHRRVTSLRARLVAHMRVEVLAQYFKHQPMHRAPDRRDLDQHAGALTAGFKSGLEGLDLTANAPDPGPEGF